MIFKINNFLFIILLHFVLGIKYDVNDFGTNNCKIGFSHIKSIKDCELVKNVLFENKSFQGIPHPEQPVSGCYIDNLHNRVYMPPYTHEKNINHMAPICKANCERIVVKYDNIINYSTIIINKTNYIDKIRYKEVYNYKIIYVNELKKMCGKKNANIVMMIIVVLRIRMVHIVKKKIQMQKNVKT